MENLLLTHKDNPVIIDGHTVNIKRVFPESVVLASIFYPRLTEYVLFQYVSPFPLNIPPMLCRAAPHFSDPPPYCDERNPLPDDPKLVEFFYNLGVVHYNLLRINVYHWNLLFPGNMFSTPKLDSTPPTRQPSPAPSFPGPIPFPPQSTSLISISFYSLSSQIHPTYLSHPPLSYFRDQFRQPAPTPHPTNGGYSSTDQPSQLPTSSTAPGNRPHSAPFQLPPPPPPITTTPRAPSIGGNNTNNNQSIHYALLNNSSLNPHSRMLDSWLSHFSSLSRSHSQYGGGGTANNNSNHVKRSNSYSNPSQTNNSNNHYHQSFIQHQNSMQQQPPTNHNRYHFHPNPPHLFPSLSTLSHLRFTPPISLIHLSLTSETSSDNQHQHLTPLTEVTVPQTNHHNSPPHPRHLGTDHTQLHSSYHHHLLPSPPHPGHHPLEGTTQTTTNPSTTHSSTTHPLTPTLGCLTAGYPISVLSAAPTPNMEAEGVLTITSLLNMCVCGFSYWDIFISGGVGFISYCYLGVLQIYCLHHDLLLSSFTHSRSALDTIPLRMQHLTRHIDTRKAPEKVSPSNFSPTTAFSPDAFSPNKIMVNHSSPPDAVGDTQNNSSYGSHEDTLTYEPSVDQSDYPPSQQQQNQHGSFHQGHAGSVAANLLHELALSPGSNPSSGQQQQQHRQNERSRSSSGSYNDHVMNRNAPAGNGGNGPNRIMMDKKDMMSKESMDLMYLRNIQHLSQPTSSYHPSLHDLDKTRLDTRSPHGIQGPPPGDIMTALLLAKDAQTSTAAHTNTTKYNPMQVVGNLPFPSSIHTLLYNPRPGLISPLQPQQLIRGFPSSPTQSEDESDDDRVSRRAQRKARMRVMMIVSSELSCEDNDSWTIPELFQTVISNNEKTARVRRGRGLGTSRPSRSRARRAIPYAGKVKCVTVSRRKTQNGLDSTVTEMIYSHHQKTVVCDAPGPYVRRRVVAFVGGLDLTRGRMAIRIRIQSDPDLPGSSGKGICPVYRGARHIEVKYR
eukprot:sb/3461603/